ncbi:winged helix-turn-helix transcriptional regulator [Dyadobacter tibetensis]|uniref:winged helix-turn-helix transcriptional regulator n=1 Tax=Dyadobacter tibetensis TaxID=1211851 RepID=UPI0004B1C2A5|nr:helix-turn-helix domain-containing protein [Dyadobacter tibetensis]
MTRTMATIGTKWKPIIIYALGNRTLRFGELHVRIDTISRKVLTDQLRELTEDGIIQRSPAQDSSRKVEYRLTEKGLALLPIMNMLTEWNLRYNESEI